MNDAEIEDLELYEENDNRRKVLLIGGGLLLCVVLLFVLLRLVQAEERPLLPMRDVAAASPLLVSDNPIRVTFSELNGNPANFLGQTLTVAGEYQPLPPYPCVAPDGPNPRWSLVAENLRLEVRGQEQIVRRLQPGTPLVIQGRFERFFGSVGCGKQLQPPQEVWYLRIISIVEPNPLQLRNNVDSFIEFDPGQPTAPADTAFAAPVEATPTDVLPAETAIPAATNVPTVIPPTELPPTVAGVSPTSEIGGSATPSATPSGDVGTPTPSSTPDSRVTTTNTPTPTSTPSDSGGNSTATPNNGGGGDFITATPGPSPTPGGGYPLPEPTERATPYGG